MALFVNFHTQGYAVTVCVANRISSRQQKPVEPRVVVKFFGSQDSSVQHKPRPTCRVLLQQ